MKKNSIYDLQLFADEENPLKATASNILLSYLHLVKKRHDTSHVLYCKNKTETMLYKKY